jgi:formyltetrahydrofolate deformylase
MKTLVLLFQCRDQKGIVAGISSIIFKCGGNIITADQHSTDLAGGYFFMRVEFLVDSSKSDPIKLKRELDAVSRRFSARYSLLDKDKKLRMGVCVSKPGHCLAEILYLWQTNELNVDIPFVISNSRQHQPLVEQYGIPFYFIPASSKVRKEAEILKMVVKETDFLVLARYMLILSAKFINSYKKDIVNIHHGFLPSFKGSNPYQQALDKGVKVIGATSHFVTRRLDEGPIISQAVEYVSHKDDLKDLVRKGKNLEKRALVEAIRSYIDYRIIRHKSKTIVF